MGNKLKRFLSFRPALQLLMIEAFLYLGWARILKAMPFSKIAPSLGNHMVETPLVHLSSNETTIKNIGKAVRTMSRYTPWESKCLVMAIAGMRMLERRRIESTLYMGTGRDASGKLIAHAWLRSGPFYISGAETMEKFTVVGIFGNSVRQTEMRGTSQHG